MVLSRREKLLVGILAGLAALTILYFLVAQMRGWEQQLQKDISRQQFLLDKARILAAGLEKTAAKPRSRNKPKRSLIGYIERLAAQNALKDRVQLNRVAIDKSKGVEGIDIKLNNLTLDEMVKFLYEIENSKPPLVVDKVDISQSFRAKKKLRLTLRVLGQI